MISLVKARQVQSFYKNLWTFLYIAVPGPWEWCLRSLIFKGFIFCDQLILSSECPIKFSIFADICQEIQKSVGNLSIWVKQIYLHISSFFCSNAHVLNFLPIISIKLKFLLGILSKKELFRLALTDSQELQETLWVLNWSQNIRPLKSCFLKKYLIN